MTAPPFGRVFRQGNTVEAVEVEPLEFPSGTARLTPDGHRHLQRVTDFLRASPYVALHLEPVVSEADLETLRREEVAARIQQLQRDGGLDFESASRRLFAAWHPGDAIPDHAAAVIQLLAPTASDTPTTPPGGLRSGAWT